VGDRVDGAVNTARKGPPLVAVVDGNVVAQRLQSEKRGKEK